MPEYPEMFPARIGILEDDWLHRILHTYIAIIDKQRWEKLVSKELEKRLKEFSKIII